jgi:prephenate dehydratase
MLCREFRDVVNSVADGAADVGIVPVENSIEGAVGEVNDLLVETDLCIVAEVLLPIHHFRPDVGSARGQIEVAIEHERSSPAAQSRRRRSHNAGYELARR